MEHFTRVRIRKLIWILMLSLLPLTGCGEVLNEYYISNHTDSAVTITMDPLDAKGTDIFAGPLIENIQHSVREELEQSVDYEFNGLTLQFELPPDTTVYLGASSGGNDLFSLLVVNLDDRQISMDVDNYKDYFELHDNLRGPIVHVFDIR